ncbi:SpoVR family protein [Alkalilimnicola sp. S0819]|uniref:SpoVR family protein n=1 Tax=Alkalilimnicola sp. S0819 TaxID=2613922 RepID=UPI00126194A9|nr:SpoVR family protein [Alkalilimnicola sp. S0819]KAB7624297.1 SpoVR family protein [Alkalilimnicola sp. S0819]MPQ16121.1 stage V sporulation protein R [Alkalilimnicola sp. S0819]
MAERLRDYIPRLEALAARHGLRHHPVDFELVPESFMMEVAVYGLPVRMPHWSFGVRWIQQMIQHRMGHSRIFEVVFPGAPNRAYLVETNSVQENVLVVAHVLGHADFSGNNAGFVRSHHEAGAHIVEQAAAHAHRIDAVIERQGIKRVEQVLDAALALEPHIDTHQPLARPDYPRHAPPAPARPPDAFAERYAQLPDTPDPEPGDSARQALPLPPHPEEDLLWFIARYGPWLEDWERDIFLAVREEAYYFQPVFNCQIMNEGWASYWHARLLREASFLPTQTWLDCMKTHSDVVRPYGGESRVALQINPYHLGFSLWERIITEQGLDAARRIMAEEDDFSFIRNHLSAAHARELGLFLWSARRNGEVRVTPGTLPQLHEQILGPRYHFGAPRIRVEELRPDGALTLRHDAHGDGRGLHTERAREVLNYIHQVWRAPVRLYTEDIRGREICLRPRQEEFAPLDESRPEP